LPVNDSRLRDTARSYRPGSTPLAYRGFSRSLRLVHDVPAAAVPDLAANDGRRLLLQHRPNRRGLWNGLFRIVLEGGRLSNGPVLRRLPVPACGGRRLALARVGEGWLTRRIPFLTGNGRRPFRRFARGSGPA